MGWEQLAGGLGFGGGGEDPGKKQWKRMLQQFQLLQGQNAGTFANAFQQLKKSQGAIRAGYGAARNETNAQQTATRQGVMDTEKRNLGALRSTLAGSGMGGGTLDANLQRGVMQDANRSLATVDANFAALRQRLAAEQAGLEANSYGALAGLFQNQAGQNNALGMSLINAIAGQQHADPNAWMGNLAQTGMQMLPFMMAGSDRRLKHDIEHVGVVNGVNEYEFSYIGQEGRYRGVMADEVPWAAFEVDGYMHVDYAQVPVRFRRVAHRSDRGVGGIETQHSAHQPR